VTSCPTLCRFDSKFWKKSYNISVQLASQETENMRIPILLTLYWLQSLCSADWNNKMIITDWEG
jgi:hypothetical protein